MLAPHKTRQPTKHRQINQLDHRTILDHCWRSTLLTHGSNTTGLDIDPDRLTSHIVDTHDVHNTKTDKQLTHHSRVNFHRGSPF
jgi:hypothetical protein